MEIRACCGQDIRSSWTCPGGWKLTGVSCIYAPFPISFDFDADSLGNIRQEWKHFIIPCRIFLCGKCHMYFTTSPGLKQLWQLDDRSTLNISIALSMLKLSLSIHHQADKSIWSQMPKETERQATLSTNNCGMHCSLTYDHKLFWQLLQSQPLWQEGQAVLLSRVSICCHLSHWCMWEDLLHTLQFRDYIREWKVCQHQCLLASADLFQDRIGLRSRIALSTLVISRILE